MRTKVVTTALAASVLAGLCASPAQADLPTERTLRDGVQSGASYDIKKVILRSASPGEPAWVITTFASEVVAGDKFTVWFNTDKDTKPEMVFNAFAYSEYSFVEWGSRRELDCVSASLSGNKASIEFDPSCVAASRTMTVAVKAVDAERQGRDKVGSPKAWPKRVRSYL